ncbi:class II aldolase and adducin N-terminal domain-containing protein [Helicobacter kayseriensis]|uniref:class II aldolase and adducin N-terminal domain-containing protein n=1 Tax=Helicobacter kayseriensis TaxID=2905877 RepID=UPI001E5D44A2|nr:class II aldolase and adducin N-terminal domain-containing protein [Helicobacter kayseriensis]MCE3047512.1 class II aldolase and adducin N-terminal domain-containing protein [Helicobacter kayseriensis]MCE3048834.1 class II aldolase and adducin N-terminal domain-containing protein [Helicobacter kayseriensis]
MQEPIDFKHSEITERLRSMSLSMFRKNFFGIFHGSISARLGYQQFIINKKRAIFDELVSKDLIALNVQKDYRWNEASIDTPIHAHIYQAHPDAKFIAYAMPPYSVSYSLTHKMLCPLDYFGQRILGKEIPILDPKDYDTWYERAVYEIPQAFSKTNQKFTLIKGYGIYAFDRDLHSLGKTIALIENTCKILHYNASLREI